MEHRNSLNYKANKINDLSRMLNNPNSDNDKKKSIENEINENCQDNFIEQFCQDLNNESEENVNEENKNETNLLTDIDNNFILKKKIYEKNIAQIEKQIQTNKLNRLIKTNEIMIEMLTLIKNRKLNTKSFF
ncbi:conserved Plasmodium protein, unknown function [Plasmodium vinckei vinckei]|uniref:Uncharacterized protein n=1 Tax=Plasmodium vinckei vinckei TaxID=54757 RepID=A0A449BXM2_PLAVN|nr:conserved Plasmodium protein, unknown function [Plasmodium vinckei vinckei]KEG04548.1 hypothetical protein YYE_00123 [Plasmodium vinckei vinckei]VEV58198.1 conserved Plasmodium protein, unknown function [Plasmodium vinckei vinckei]